MNSVLAVVVLLAVLITLHELGHFLVAKACGVRVRVFSVGFGPRLFGVTVGETDYRVSLLPLGGYVRMAGSDPFGDSGSVADEDDDPAAPGAFLAAPAWKRILIVAAGPVMNLLLPFAVFTAVLMHGEEQAVAEIGDVEDAEKAGRAGVRVEDRIVSVNGAPVRTWNDVMDAAGEERVPLALEVVGADGVRRTVTLPAADDGMGVDALWDVGVGIFAPGTVVTVDDPASPFGRAGVPTGARLVRVDGVAVRDWHDVRRALDVSTPERLAARVLTPVTVAWEAAPGEGDAAPAAREASVHVDPAWNATRTAADDALWAAWGLASADTTVGNFSKDEPSAAEQAGLRVHDRVLAIDDSPVRAWGDLVRLVAASGQGEGEAMKARPVRITFRREGEVRTIEATPRTVRDTDARAQYRWRVMLGVGNLGEFAQPELVKRPYPFAEAFPRAVDETVTQAKGLVGHLGKMLTNEVDPRKSVGGIVAISRQSKAAAERGLLTWARFLGLISISLGVVNLMPVPVLDGGQLLMYLAEWVRGRPLPLALRERLQQVGVMLLLALFLFSSINDLVNWLSGS